MLFLSFAGLGFTPGLPKAIWVYPQTAQFVLAVNPVMGGSFSFVEIELTPTLSSEPTAGRSSCPDYSEAADISQIEVYTKILPFHNKIHDESNESPF